MKRKLIAVAMICVLAAGLASCGSKEADQKAENIENTEATSASVSADNTEQTVYREGFSIYEISDDLFARMKGGNTYKEECIVPEGEIEKRIEALLASSECPIHQVAQDRSFYSHSIDEIVLPLRSAFTDDNAFAEVAAHEMIHSTGHSSRLARKFGSRDPFGRPDDKYCMEELRHIWKDILWR